MEEIRKSLSSLAEDVKTVAKQQDTLMELINEIKLLKNIVKEKDKKIDDLERRIDELEQYTRKDDLIISGLETTHRTYARAASGDKPGDDAPLDELETLERQVIKFFASKNMVLQSDCISACHTLPRKDSRTKPAIAIRLVNRKHKSELLRQARKLKGTGGVPEQTSYKKNADLARHACIL